MRGRTRTGGRRLRRAAAVCAFACLAAADTSAQAVRPAERAAPFTVPTWAFPQASGPSAAVDSTKPRHVPNSSAAFTEAEALDFYRVLDWQPGTHPPMPAVVARGRKPAVFACGFCHLADGMGRPENAMLAGLPEAYILEQIGDLRAGARASARLPFGPGMNMRREADSATSAEVAVAARYFSRLPARRRSQVVEATRVPRTVADNGLYFPDPRGGEEPLGDRLIEVAASRERHELHDPAAPYVAYVPPGSIARGRALATGGRSGGTAPCVVCHGPGLRGSGLLPPLAGRAPSYLLRQLLAFRTGTRSSALAAPMRAEAATLGLDDMIAVAAYAATLQP